MRDEMRGPRRLIFFTPSFASCPRSAVWCGVVWCGLVGASPPTRSLVIAI